MLPKSFLKFFKSFVIVCLLFMLTLYLNVHIITKSENEEYRIDLTKFYESINKPLCSCRPTIKLTRNGNDLRVDTFNYTITEDDIVNSKLSCNPLNVLRRGFKQKVISFSVYGKNPFYFRYLELIAQTASKLFPDWVVRFYHDETFDNDFICKLECKYSNVDFCNVDTLPFERYSRKYLIPTFWRWLPIGDLFVDIFLSRDSDFCMVERDRDAVQEWLTLNTLFHVMRDHPFHDLHMLAGMWGLWTEKDRQLSQRVYKTIFDPSMKYWHKKNFNEKQADQIFLRIYLWDLVKQNVTAHDSFHCKSLGGRPFPTQRPWFYCHVGGYGCCGPEYLNSSFTYECPYECRPKEHKEWIFC